MTTRDALLIGACIAAGSIGCSNPDAAPATYRYTASSANAWAGSTITVVSAGLAAHSEVGSVEFAAYSLPVQRVNDSTVSVVLPDTMSGSFAPTLRIGTLTQPLDSITVYGYVGVTSYPFASNWDTYAWPRSGPHAMIMTSGDDDSLRFVDLDSHQYNSLGGELVHGGSGVGLWGPGPSYDGSYYLQHGSEPNNFTFAPWSLTPTPSPIASGLAWFIGLPDGTQNVMRLGPTTWFASGKGGSRMLHAQDTAVASLDGSQVAPIDGIGGNMSGTLISPRGDRAAILPANSSGGVPVFTMPDGNIAFRIAGIQADAADADFSPDGSRLVMAGDSGAMHRVILVDATSGTVVHDTTVDFSVQSVRLSPDNARVYVEAATPDSAQSPVAWYARVLVLDAGTFNVLGRLTAPHSSPQVGGCHLCDVGRIALNSTGSLYFYAGLSNPSHAWQFTVAPQAASAQAVLRPRSTLSSSQ